MISLVLYFSKKEETRTCFSSVIEIYSTGCAETQVESTVTRAIVLAASRYSFHIDHCFGKTLVKGIVLGHLNKLCKFELSSMIVYKKSYCTTTGISVGDGSVCKFNVKVLC